MPRSDYAGNYAGNIAGIYRDLARSQAEAKLRSGQAWAGAIGEIGQTIAGLPGQLAQDKENKQRAALLEENLRIAAEQRQEDQWFKDAMNSSVVDGRIDERRLTENLTLMGAAQLVPKAVTVIRESDAALQRLKNAQQQGQINEQTLKQMALDYFKPFAAVIEESDFNPGVVNGALSVVALQAGQGEADGLRQMLSADPTAARMFVKSLIAPKAQKPLVPVSEGTALFDPNTNQQVFENPKPEAAQSLEQQLAAAVARRDGAEVSRIRNEMMRNAAATRAPQQPRDDRLVQVMGPEGTPIWVREADAVGKPAAQAARAVTGAERQSLAYFNRAKDASENIADLEPKIAKLGLTGQVGMHVLPNFLQSQDGQLYRQAQRSFTEARLRKESGAAIPSHEYENDAKTYFAQPGDSVETQKQKRAARDKVLEGLAYAAGKAYDEFYGEPLKKSGGKTGPTAEELIKKYGGG